MPPGVVPWLCPRCLLGQAAGDALDHPAALDGSGSIGSSGREGSGEIFPQRFGGYELLARIGQGGMGIVYKGRQVSLDRIVAVKVLPLGALATKEQVRRFRTEAAAAGSLQHPNIVAIHEVGLWEDRHYLVMDFVEGPTLAELARAGPLAPTRAARYVQKMAQAIHYAHERGILHRDLKPSNVLIDAADELRITDFGLAKRLESGSDLTLSGQVLGSPQYMPPEQAAGRQREVRRGSDVYALGAVLYHLLTGRPPFLGETAADVLPQVLNDEPLTPRQLNPVIPADLETLCLKCLEKEMPRRYPSALALAEELGRFLRGEPIVARPVGYLGKAWRWRRRNPRLALAIGVAAFSLVIGLAGVAWQWRRAEVQRVRAEANEYVLSMNVVQQAIKASNPARALELLNRYGPGSAFHVRSPGSKTDPRGFEWRYLWQQCQTEAEADIGKLQIGVAALEVSADGRWLYAGARGSAGGVWDLTTSKRVPFAAEGALYSWGAFSPDSRSLLICDQTLQSEGTISVWDLQAREKVSPIVDGRPVGPMRFSPDGKRFGYTVMLPSGNAGLVVLDFPSRQRVCELVGKAKVPKGWDWVFTRDGSHFFGPGDDTGRSIGFREIAPDSEPRYFPGHREAIMAMALSPDGAILATGADETDANIKLWEVASFRLLGELAGHQGPITALAFSPDGQTLASAAVDRTMRLWDVRTKKARRVFAGLSEDVWRVAFGADRHGLKLFSGSSDGTIRRYSAETQENQPDRGFWQRPAGDEAVPVAPDGTRYAVLRQGRVYVGEAQGVTPPSEVAELGTNNTCLLFSLGGRSLFAGTKSGELQVWSLDRRQPLLRLRGSAEPVEQLRQGAQGRLLVAVHWRPGVELGRSTRGFVGKTLRFEAWTTADWQQQTSWTIPAYGDTWTEVSPDGRWLAVNDKPGSLQVWNLARPSEVRIVSAPEGKGCELAFSPGGKYLAAASLQGTVKIWEMPGLHGGIEFRAHAQAVFALAFSPDSRRLATAGEGAESIKLWDVATWQELITLERPGEQLKRVVFSTDGSQLTALNSGGDLLFWRVPSFAEIEAARNKSSSH